MTQDNNQDVVPRGILRVPGRWKNRKQLTARLPKGYFIEGERLFMPGARYVFLETMPADREFPGIFRLACRRQSLKRDELAALDDYSMNAALAAPAGSLAAAQFLLEVGATLIQAGGMGVFIDNSVLAHAASDWLDLAEHRTNPDAVFWAFVNLTKSSGKIASHGMHVFGQRDAIVGGAADLNSLEDFLRMACVSQPKWAEGETFADKQGRRFCLRGEVDRGMFPSHPMNNPYGRWRLEPL